MLKWLRTGAWSKLTDVLTAIRQELQSVQPIDTASIRWEKDAEGMRAYYTGRTGGSEVLTVDEGGTGQGRCSGIVNVCFDAEEGTLSAFMPVVLTGTIADDVNSFKYDTVFTCQKLDASSDRKAVIGILQEDLEAGEVGRCVISGMTLAYVYFAYSAYTSFRSARFNYSDTYPLVAAADGDLQIISSQSGNYYYGNNLCAINLSAGSSDDYNGKFKVGKIDDKLYIYDGSNKDNAYAGTIVAGSSGITFPKTELALVNGDVYVILKWTPEDDDTSGSWSTHVHQGNMWTSPYYNDPRAAHFLVASVVSERVTQQHKSGNIIVTGRWV